MFFMLAGGLPQTIRLFRIADIEILRRAGGRGPDAGELATNRTSEISRWTINLTKSWMINYFFFSKMFIACDRISV
jgi:hypothetical protein